MHRFRWTDKSRFTDEQMIEIGKVRERLTDYMNKVQPYPAYPEEEPIKPVETIVRHITVYDVASRKPKSKWD